MSLPPLEIIHRTVEAALREDLGELSIAGDITACLIQADKQGTARLFSREEGLLCGCAWFNASFTLLDKDLRLDWHSHDGDKIEKDQILCEVQGRVRSILAGERTALNFLQLLSGTATQSAYWAGLQTHKTRIFDTRKTIPGLRAAQKYAVRTGGCQNHRFGTYDAFLIKENHLKCCDSMVQLVALARRQAPDKAIILEVETMAELQEAIKLEIQVVLLDNFTRTQISQAIQLVKTAAKNADIALEISGGVTASQMMELRKLGVGRISVGSLTKHCQALDFSLRFN